MTGAQSARGEVGPVIEFFDRRVDPGRGRFRRLRTDSTKHVGDRLDRHASAHRDVVQRGFAHLVHPPRPLRRVPDLTHDNPRARVVIAMTTSCRSDLDSPGYGGYNVGTKLAGTTGLQPSTRCEEAHDSVR